MVRMSAFSSFQPRYFSLHLLTPPFVKLLIGDGTVSNCWNPGVQGRVPDNVDGDNFFWFAENNTSSNLCTIEDDKATHSIKAYHDACLVP